MTPSDGLYTSVKVEKTEVSLDDLFSGDNFYGKQMKLEYGSKPQAPLVDNCLSMVPDAFFRRLIHLEVVNGGIELILLMNKSRN